MTDHFDPSADMDVVSKGIILGARDVAVLVRAELIQGMTASTLGGDSAQSGSRSDAGGDAQSKQIKMETLAILEHGDKASSSQIIPLESTVASYKGAGSSSDYPIVTGECMQPVCENANEREIIDSVDRGSKYADNSSMGMTSHDVKKLIVAEGGDPSTLGALGVVLVEEPDRASNPMEFNEIPNIPMEFGTLSVVETEGGVYEELELSFDDTQTALCSLMKWIVFFGGKVSRLLCSSVE